MDKMILKYLMVGVTAILIGLLLVYFKSNFALQYVFLVLGSCWGSTLFIVAMTLVLESFGHKHGNH